MEAKHTQEIFITFDKLDGEAFCAFTSKSEAEYEAKESGCGVKTISLISAPDLLAENQKLKQEKEELVEMLEEAEQLFTEIRRSLSLHPDCVENSEFQDLAYGSQEMEEKILSLIQNCIGK